MHHGSSNSSNKNRKVRAVMGSLPLKREKKADKKNGDEKKGRKPKTAVHILSQYVTLRSARLFLQLAITKQASHEVTLPACVRL